MGKARKLPSGKWNVVGYYKDINGTIHRPSFTSDTKADALYQLKLFETRLQQNGGITTVSTVKDAVTKYIEISRASLSPTTIQRYESISAFAFPDLMEMQITHLTNEIIQKEINKECRRTSTRKDKPLSAKTIHGEWGLLSAALKSICNLSFNVKLPKQHKDQYQLPDPKEILRIVINTDVELPCLLAMWLSFSISEIKGLMCSSIKDGEIYINQVNVTVGGHDFIKKNAKVESRKRRLCVPDYIMALIEKLPNYQDYLQNGEDSLLIRMSRVQITRHFKKLANDNGYELTFHSLRHLNASVMLALNIPEKYAMERGGWSTPHTMQTVYQHTFNKERKAVDEMIDAKFEEMIKDL